MATTKRELTDTPVQGRLLTVEQVAELLGVPRSFIYRRTCRGHSDPIPSFRIGGHLRFRAHEVEGWIEAHRNEQPPPEPEPAPAPMVTSGRRSAGSPRPKLVRRGAGG